MTTDSLLRPATPDELADSLAFALRYDGRKRLHRTDEAMARITAQHLIADSEASRPLIPR